MPIQFQCTCGKQLQAQEEYAGRQTRCPGCGSTLTIPGPTATIQPSIPIQPETTAVQQRRDISHLEDDEDDERRRRPRRRRAEGPEGTSKAAVASLILGLCCFGFCLTGIPAVILGIQGLRAVASSEGRLKGQGMAITGIILGCFALVLSITALPIALIVPAVQKVREAAVRIQSANNLKQLSIAMMMYADDHQGRLPPAVVYDRQGKPLYSWRVLLLPYIENDHLYKQFHLDEAWDSPNNSKLLSAIPKAYSLPDSASPNDRTLTYYQVFDGPGAAFNSDRSGRLQPFQIPGVSAQLMESSWVTRYPASFTDGTSNTILIAEAADAVPWTKPVDLHFDPTGPLPSLGGPLHGDFSVVLADGQVRFVRKGGISQETLRALITANGGEALPANW
jgi:hypothetical protein